MKIIVTSLSILFCAFTMNVTAQTAKTVKKAEKIEKTEKTNKGNAYGKNKGDLKGKEFGQDRAANAKIQAKKDKEVVENNIETLVKEIQNEEKNLTEVKAQKDPANNQNNQVDEAIKASENKIKEMTEKLKEQNNKLKELDKIINEKE